MYLYKRFVFVVVDDVMAGSSFDYLNESVFTGMSYVYNIIICLSATPAYKYVHT